MLSIQCCWCGEHTHLHQGQTRVHCRMGHVVNAEDHRRVVDESSKERAITMRQAIVKDFDQQSDGLKDFWIRQIRLIDNALAEYSLFVENIPR